MTIVTDAHVHHGRRSPSGLTLRVFLLARAAVLSVTSLLAVALLPLWATLVALSPLTVLAWSVLPATSAVRAYANANRRAAGVVLGERIAAPYRTVEDRRWLSRVWTTLRDPATWRDAVWLLVHAITACTLSMLQVALFAGGVFYLVFPFLYWVTPHEVFGRPFGFFELHTVGQAAWLAPIALVGFGLWWATAFPLARAEASVTKWLLR